MFEKLGQGGFGSVYRAWDEEAGVEVALKGLPPLVSHNPEELESVRSNFAFVAKLAHPNIATIRHLHRVEHVDEKARNLLRVSSGDYLVVMDYVNGSTLSVWRSRFPDKKVPVEQALELCRQIAEALDYAHAQKVIHRDIKPSNVMVETSGETQATTGGTAASPSTAKQPQSLNIKVLDFGLAAEIRSSMSRVSKEQGNTSGTRSYMAPEQWVGKKQGSQTDQYALAVLFYELVSGEVPFQSVFETGDVLLMMNVVQSQEVEYPNLLDKKLRDVLSTAFSKKIDARFDSCCEFVSSLVDNKRKKKASSRKLVLAFVAAAVAVLVVFVLYYLYNELNMHRQEKVEVVNLKKSIETELATKSLKEVGDKLLEFERLTSGSDPDLLKMRAAYESQVGWREVNDLYGEAKVEHDKVMVLDRGQGFGQELDEIEKALNTAEVAREGEKWGQSVGSYNYVLSESEIILGIKKQRASAVSQRAIAEKVRKDAAAENAAEDASESWGAAVTLAGKALESFESGEFKIAEAEWKQCVQRFESAKKQALDIQSYRSHKKAYEDAESSEVFVLKKYGGEKWKAVEKQARCCTGSYC